MPNPDMTGSLNCVQTRKGGNSGKRYFVAKPYILHEGDEGPPCLRTESCFKPNATSIKIVGIESDDGKKARLFRCTD